MLRKGTSDITPRAARTAGASDVAFSRSEQASKHAS